MLNDKVNPRKRTWIKFLLTLVLVAISFWVSAAKTLAIDSKRLVRVGVYDNPPKIFTDGSGKVSGLFADVLDYVADRENWRLDYVDGTWDEGLARLTGGQIDIMVDVAISPEREERFDFTKETVFNSWGVVYVRKDSAIESFKDLGGKKVAILKSGIYYLGSEGIVRYIDAFGLKVEFVNVHEYKEVFDLLSQGEVDAAVVSRVFGLSNERLYPDLKATGIFFSPTELRFALTKGDPENVYLVDRLDFWVRKLKEGEGGVYAASLKKHGLLGLLPEREVLPDWVKWLGGGLGIVLLTMLMGSWILVRARKDAIKELEKKEKQLGQVISNVPIAVFGVDHDGKITLAEGEVVESLGLNKLIGKSIFEHYKDNKVITESTIQALAGTEVNYKVEIGGRTLRVDLRPVKVPDGRYRIDGVAVDMTEEVKLEREKSKFVSLVSHHLRTPPTAIKWGMELLSTKVLPILDDEGKNLWRGMEDANNKMIELANSLSKSMRIGLKAASFESKGGEEYDIKQLVEAVRKTETEVKEK